MREAMYINKSLTFLEQVTRALTERNRDHIPYRQCKLTHLLKDAIGGNCSTVMIANVWPEMEHIEETVSVLISSKTSSYSVYMLTIIPIENK